MLLPYLLFKSLSHFVWEITKSQLGNSPRQDSKGVLSSLCICTVLEELPNNHENLCKKILFFFFLVSTFFFLSPDTDIA